MIRSQAALAQVFSEGRTVARLQGLQQSDGFRWATTDTNEPVHTSAIHRLEAKGKARAIACDLCGHPMQYGGVQ